MSTNAAAIGDKLEASRNFRDAAVADGWFIEPTYGTSESVDHAARLQKDGYIMQVITRPPAERTNGSASVHIWGPDGLAIATPNVYSFEELKKSTRRCQYCKAEDVQTDRVGFAGRACLTCAPIEEAKLGKRYYD